MIEGTHPRTKFLSRNGQVLDNRNQVPHRMGAFEGSLSTPKGTQEMLVKPERLYETAQQLVGTDSCF
jgi:hypothetical protein